jgi:hypothetical protein
MAFVTDQLAARCAVAVMGKASIPGLAKTRLSPPLSSEEAAALNTAFLRDICDNLLAARDRAPIDPWIAFAPRGAEAFFRSHVPASVDLIETVEPCFGDCLHFAASLLLKRGYGSVCLLNSDSPTLPVAYLVTAATALATPGDRVVLGPSADGGYYLIGLKVAHRGMFEKVSWSTEYVFQQSLARAKELALPVVILPTWYDVDDASSLAKLLTEVVDGRPFKSFGELQTPAAHTFRVLQRLVDDFSLRVRLEAAARSDQVA